MSLSVRGMHRYPYNVRGQSSSQAMLLFVLHLDERIVPPMFLCFPMDIEFLLRGDGNSAECAWKRFHFQG